MMDRVRQIVYSRIKSQTTLKLVNKLEEIWDNPDFLLIAVFHLKTDEERQKLLDIMEKENLTTFEDTDEITLTAWKIEDGLL